MSDSKKRYTLGISDVLIILFVVLKLLGVITWSWLWVLSPIWIALIIIIVLYGINAILDNRLKNIPRYISQTIRRESIEKKRQFPKQPIRYLINRIQLYGNAAVVDAYLEGNIVRIKVQRCGLFKQYKGIPFIYELEIDPTLIVQSQE